jgi:uncharacterized protein
MTYIDKAITEKKLQNLFEQLKNFLADGVIIAYSGGLDSAILIWAAEKVRKEHGGKLLALTTNSVSIPRAELDEAIEFAKKIGVEHKIVKSNEIENDDYKRNDLNRCYYCRVELFRITGEVANIEGYKNVLYGYNFSDINDTRAGHKAAEENNIVSPLADAKLTKDEIRYIMRQNGFNISEKPASPCLSSRIMTGIEVTPKRLSDIETMEAILKKNGAKIYRVRVCKDGKKEFLRIEMADNEIGLAVKLRKQLTDEGKKRGYYWVTLDLSGYKMGGGVK